MSALPSGPCRILLSVKVLDTEQKLRETLVHEMCHAAVLLLDKDLYDQHGPKWKFWAQLALWRCDELKEVMQRCHNYSIHNPCGYRCGLWRYIWVPQVVHLQV